MHFQFSEWWMLGFLHLDKMLSVSEEFTAWYSEHMAVVVAFDFDLRKNFEPQIAQRYWAALKTVVAAWPPVKCVLVYVAPVKDRSW